MDSGAILPIIAVLGLLVLVLLALIREWAPPDVIAMSAFCVVVISGLLTVNQAFAVFQNTAPITIGALFILSAALEKTGLINALGETLNRFVSSHLWVTLPAVMVVAASASAFVNNTPVVAIFLPVLLAISRKKQIPASKLMIPLSYATVLGGCCTLIGTSTNILVSGIAVQYNQPNIGMFEFAPLGVLLAAVGVTYIWIFAPWCLPDRLSITSVLAAEDRQQFLCHLLIKPESPLVGQRLTLTDLASESNGFRIIEVRRAGTRVTESINQIVVHSYDRVLVAVSLRNMAKGSGQERILDPNIAARLHVENLSVIKGAIMDGVISPHSRLIGHSLRSARFRQTYGMLVLAVHRAGKNLASHFQDVDLEFGDTMLMLGPVSTFEQMRVEGDFMLLEDRTPARPKRWQSIAVILLLTGVVVASAFETVPIVFAAVTACVIAMWLKCITPQQAYKSVDWSILFMLYGMLGLGTAMETTGAAKWVADATVNVAEFIAPQEWLPIVVLSLFYLTGNLLTEVLSNNATAVVLAPIAINSALQLGLDPRPFIMAILFSSSLAFASPIGYQSHMMVYGPGGYRFSDFVRFGLPLNILLWALASYLIPLYWPF